MTLVFDHWLRPINSGCLRDAGAHPGLLAMPRRCLCRIGKYRAIPPRINQTQKNHQRHCKPPGQKRILVVESFNIFKKTRKFLPVTNQNTLLNVNIDNMKFDFDNRFCSLSGVACVRHEAYHQPSQGQCPHLQNNWTFKLRRGQALIDFSASMKHLDKVGTRL